MEPHELSAYFDQFAPRPDRRCRTGKALDLLSPEDREYFEAGLAAGQEVVEIRQLRAAFAAKLGDDGAPSATAIIRHRQGTCMCAASAAARSVAPREEDAAAAPDDGGGWE